ncbi:ATP-dependent protease LonB [Candidatus Woesearchaeota archaeon CG10_big_fil_rev_8_21_14_0_10_34_8]|nr:MAG: ATP-dependent protease LonB [Candidatus Woesearchaeota archaeon CG10_big_fil_rev_8_21_14_0_10_34_8]
MLGMALAELLKHHNLLDVLAYPNNNDTHHPVIRTFEAGRGRQIVEKSLKMNNGVSRTNVFLIIIAIFAFLFPMWSLYYFGKLYGYTAGAVIFAGSLLASILAFGFAFFGMRMSEKKQENPAPKLLVDNFNKENLPFYDGTGAHAGSLLGDILHDPYQSGGLGTPAHERVVAGLIHKAHKGVLFIDEIGTMQMSTQQDLLTALQEGRFSITGQSSFSAGAMVRTDPVPCQFILIAAGNMDNIKDMHPALRSRIRGYGYEVYMDETMLDTKENRRKIMRFVAQEVVKDKKIPHFTMDAVDAIIEEARSRANKKNHLTLKLRELGGLIRAAGDIAVSRNATLVTKQDVADAHEISRTLEHQISDKIIEEKKSYDIIMTSGKKTGRVNCLAVIGNSGDFSGIVLPIETQATPAEKSTITGMKTDIIAVLEHLFGAKKSWHYYVQFLTSHKIEGNDFTMAAAAALVSTVCCVPVKQEIAVTGSLSVRGDALYSEFISEKLHAAVEAGFKKIIVPASNVDDIDKKMFDKIEIIPVSNIMDVLKNIIDWKGKEYIFNKLKKQNGSSR